MSLKKDAEYLFKKWSPGGQPGVTMGSARGQVGVSQRSGRGQPGVTRGSGKGSAVVFTVFEMFLNGQTDMGLKAC